MNPAVNGTHKEIRRLQIKGFTLIEVIMVVVLIGIMSAISIPMISSWVPNYRLKSAARDVHSAAMKAKSEAVKRSTNAALTFNQNIGGVEHAFVVYVDSNGNCKYDSGDILVHQVQEWPRGVGRDLSEGGGDGLSFLDNDDGNPTIVFRPTGIPTDKNNSFANGSVFLVSSSGRQMSVVINRTGSIRIN